MIYPGLYAANKPATTLLQIPHSSPLTYEKTPNKSILTRSDQCWGSEVAFLFENIPIVPTDAVQLIGQQFGQNKR